ncbi:MAG TPA: methylenetetrahydrofolate reductase [NAD(P)H], partial [Lachnospiraceae bacterium]|nr:methylenetetrahydrofolate reductase [NAD(P)H] [Lachnospiraceae bacterium]
MLREKLAKKRPILSFEIFPPKREEALTDIEGTIEVLCDLKPDFISITFGAGGTDTNSLTIEMARLIKEKYGTEPMVHLTCLNHDHEEILKILARLQEYGIENILALRGDRREGVRPKEEFHHASDLIRFIRKHGDFMIGAACYPEGHTESKSMEEDIRYLKQKVDAGAEHLLSQLFFDNRFFYSFMENAKAAGITASVEAGIMPVISRQQTEKMTALCGASLPEKFTYMMRKYENNKEALSDAGIAYALDQVVDLLAHDTDGIHIYTMNQ